MLYQWKHEFVLHYVHYRSNIYNNFAQEQAPIYKCRNLRGNLDCNLFSEIIQISLTAHLTDAAAQRRSREQQQKDDIDKAYSVDYHFITRIALYVRVRRSWADRRPVDMKVTPPVLTLQMCQVLSQPPIPNWGAARGRRAHLASPQYMLPATSSPQIRTDDLSLGCFNKSTPEAVIPGTVPSSRLPGISWEITQSDVSVGTFHVAVWYVSLSSKEASNNRHTHTHSWGNPPLN